MYQDLPFEKIVEVLKLGRTGYQVPLINVLFVLQNPPSSSLPVQGLEVSPINIESHTARFDFALFLREEEQQITGSVNYRTDLFTAEAIARLCAQFEVTLHSVIASPDTAIADIEIYPKGRRKKEKER